MSWVFSLNKNTMSAVAVPQPIIDEISMKCEHGELGTNGFLAAFTEEIGKVVWPILVDSKLLVGHSVNAVETEDTKIEIARKTASFS